MDRIFKLFIKIRLENNSVAVQRDIKFSITFNGYPVSVEDERSVASCPPRIILKEKEGENRGEMKIKKEKFAKICQIFQISGIIGNWFYTPFPKIIPNLVPPNGISEYACLQLTPGNSGL